MAEFAGEYLKQYRAIVPMRGLPGGNRLLFYRAAGASAVDEETEIDGMPCRVWSERCLGLHARDLNRLADVLEAEQATPAFEWPPPA